jgi:hypothetical protein
MKVGSTGGLRTHAPRAASLIVAMLLLTPVSARAAAPEPTPRCIGWAVPGAVGGLALGFGAAAGGLALAGRSLDESTPGIIATVVLAESAGMILGPVATCAAFGREPYVFPAASFAIGGGLVGGAATLLPLMALTLNRGGLVRAGELTVPFDPLILTAAVTAGIVAGGWGGLRLERWIRRPRVSGAEIAILPSGAGLALVARW